MSEPEQDHTDVYQINPDHMELAIQEFLTPVIDTLAALGTRYGEARAEVTAAHQNQTPGWFGGEGNGEVIPASSSFLNEVGYQLGLLVADQNELTASLTNYRDGLLDHISWARKTDKAHAERFQSIARDLGQAGR